ncbi:MAG: CRISPR-associated endonuclease Cas1, partial [Stellaceae bacterium]
HIALPIYIFPESAPPAAGLPNSRPRRPDAGRTLTCPVSHWWTWRNSFRICGTPVGFQYGVERSAGSLTSLAGLPLYLDLIDTNGPVAAIRQRVRVAGGQSDRPSELSRHIPGTASPTTRKPGRNAACSRASLPSRIILLDGSGAITLDVLAWLAEQNIPLIQLDWGGNVVAAIGTNSLGADPVLLRRRVMAAQDPRRSIDVATWLVREKLGQSKITLERAAPVAPARDSAIARIEGEIARLGQPWAGSKTALLGLEGKCASVYFNAWRGIPLNWCRRRLESAHRRCPEGLSGGT